MQLYLLFSNSSYIITRLNVAQNDFDHLGSVPIRGITWRDIKCFQDNHVQFKKYKKYIPSKLIPVYLVYIMFT